MKYLEKYVKVVGRFLFLFLYCRKRRQPAKLSFFMYEIAYWGTDQVVKYLFSYFDSPQFSL